jgi:hypothetical protein
VIGHQPVTPVEAVASIVEPLQEEILGDSRHQAARLDGYCCLQAQLRNEPSDHRPQELLQDRLIKLTGTIGETMLDANGITL